MSINLNLGDCLEAMQAMPDNAYELAIVDPPYGIGADKAQNATAKQRIKANGKSKAGRGWKLYKDTDWDNEIPKDDYWKELKRISVNQIVWGGNYMTEYLQPSMGWVLWDKMQRDFSLADGELAWTSFNKALRIFSMSRGAALAEHNKSGGRFHPTQKPVKLYEWLLDNYAKEGDRILDTHLGSGSIALACHNRGYSLDAYEIDEEYYNAAKERLRVHQSQLTIF